MSLAMRGAGGRGRARTGLIVSVSGFALALVGCSGADGRGPVEIMEYHLTDDRSLTLIVGTCHGEPEVTSRSVDHQRVEIEVTSTSRAVGDSCLDEVQLTLDAPLGGRSVIDATTDRVVPRT